MDKLNEEMALVRFLSGTQRTALRAAAGAAGASLIASQVSPDTQHTRNALTFAAAGATMLKAVGESERRLTALKEQSKEAAPAPATGAAAPAKQARAKQAPAAPAKQARAKQAPAAPAKQARAKQAPAAPAV